MRRLHGKRVLITGGSRGLGRALVLAAAKAGASVAFTYSSSDRDAAQTQTQVAELGATAEIFKGSVADADHVKHVFSVLQERWEGLDVLINNAGINQMYPLALIEEEDWDRLMNVNVKGAFLCARAAAKLMIRARAGHILNVGSFASERFVESPIHYAAAKSALRGMTEALSIEVGRYGVQVNLLAPGILDTGLSSMLPQHRLQDYLDQCPQGRSGTATEVAAAAVFLVSADNSFMTGAKIALDGGI